MPLEFSIAMGQAKIGWRMERRSGRTAAANAILHKTPAHVFVSHWASFFDVLKSSDEEFQFGSGWASSALGEINNESEQV